MKGTLYIVSTPIGNLEDITLRALRILNESAVIACEDTRHTRRLLAHYDIATPMISYHEHNEAERAPQLIARMEEGASIALVSDAGTPLVSDPGYRLVSESIKAGIRVEPIPGASAVMAAIAAAGLSGAIFTFAGFLPPREKARRDRLQELSTIPGTLVLYEAPHRIRQALADAFAILGDRPAVLARELTKMHEDFVRGSLGTLAGDGVDFPDRGEFVLLIGPSDGKGQRMPVTVTNQSIGEAVEALMKSQRLDQKQALKQVASARGISRRDAYNLLVKESNNPPADASEDEPGADAVLADSDDKI